MYISWSQREAYPHWENDHFLLICTWSIRWWLFSTVLNCTMDYLKSSSHTMWASDGLLSMENHTTIHAGSSSVWESHSISEALLKFTVFSVPSKVWWWVQKRWAFWIQSLGQGIASSQPNALFKPVTNISALAGIFRISCQPVTSCSAVSGQNRPRGTK